MKTYVYVDQYHDMIDYYFATTDEVFVAEFNRRKKIRSAILRKAIRKYGDYGGKPEDHRARKIWNRLFRNILQDGKFIEVPLFEGRMTNKIMNDYLISAKDNCDCE